MLYEQSRAEQSRAEQSRAEQSRAEQSRAEQRHLYGIDVLKIMACFAVVGLHTISRTGEALDQILFIACGFAIPLFFMINGYNILNSNKLGTRYLIKKIFHYFLVAFIWSLFLGILYTIMKGDNFEPVSNMLEAMFLQRGKFGIFWFLGALIIVYIITIFIHKFCLIQGKNKKIPIIVLFIVCLCVDVLKIFTCVKIGTPIQSFIPQTFRVWTWYFYFALGLELDNNKYKVLSNNRKWIWLIAVFFINICLQYFFSFKVLHILLPEYYYDSITTMIVVYTLFACFKNISVNSDKAKRVIRELAADSMGIYILHIFVKRLVIHFILIKSIETQIIAWILIFIISASISSVIRRLPVVKRLIV